MKNLDRARAWARAHKRVTLAAVALVTALTAEYLPGVPVEPLTALVHAFIGV